MPSFQIQSLIFFFAFIIATQYIIMYIYHLSSLLYWSTIDGKLLELGLGIVGTLVATVNTVCDYRTYKGS